MLLRSPSLSLPNTQRLLCSCTQRRTSKELSTLLSRLSEREEYLDSTEVTVLSSYSPSPRTTLDSEPTPMFNQMCSLRNQRQTTSFVVSVQVLLSLHSSLHHKKHLRLNLSTISFHQTHSIRTSSMVSKRLFKLKELVVCIRDMLLLSLNNQLTKESDSWFSQKHRAVYNTTSRTKSSVISYQVHSQDSAQQCSTTQLMSSRQTCKDLKQLSIMVSLGVPSIF